MSLKKDSVKKLPVKTPQKKEVSLSKEDERTLAKITDPALRNALRAFRVRCYQE